MKDLKENNKRIFICLVLIVIMIALTGCHTTKFKWFPHDPTTPVRQEAKELGGIEIDVLEVSF